MLECSEEVISALSRVIDEVIASLDEKEDIRLIITRLDEIRMKFRLMAELKDTPENHFIAFLYVSIFQWILSAYTRRPEEWYRLNVTNIQSFRPILRQFMASLKETINQRSYEGLVELFKNFFFELFHHTRYLSSERP